LYRFFIVDKQDPDTRLFSSAPFFVFSYATSQWAGSPFRPLVKVSDLQIRAGSEPDSNTLSNLKLLKRLVLPWCRLPGSHERTSTELSLSARIGCLFSGHQNWRPNASEKQRKFVKIEGFCSARARPTVTPAILPRIVNFSAEIAFSGLKQMARRKCKFLRRYSLLCHVMDVNPASNPTGSEACSGNVGSTSKAASRSLRGMCEHRLWRAGKGCPRFRFIPQRVEVFKQAAGELLPCRGKALVLVKEVMGDFVGEHE